MFPLRSAAVVAPARRRRKAYMPPAMLSELQVLDLLEISGNQVRAARYHSLLERLAGVLEVPPCFHAAGDWALLVQQGVIDGAIVSSLCHAQLLPASRLPQWEGVRAVPLGTLMLQLVCHRSWAEAEDPCLLLPGPQEMPLLHEQIELELSNLEPSARSWQDPLVCLNELPRRPLVLPICSALAANEWWQERGLVAVAQQPALRQRLWLLLPDDLEISHAAEATLRLIHRRVIRAAARGEGALLEPLRRLEEEGEGSGEVAA